MLQIDKSRKSMQHLYWLVSDTFWSRNPSRSRGTSSSVSTVPSWKCQYITVNWNWKSRKKSMWLLQKQGEIDQLTGQPIISQTISYNIQLAPSWRLFVLRFFNKLSEPLKYLLPRWGTVLAFFLSLYTICIWILKSCWSFPGFKSKIHLRHASSCSPLFYGNAVTEKPRSFIVPKGK